MSKVLDVQSGYAPVVQGSCVRVAGLVCLTYEHTL